MSNWQRRLACAALLLVAAGIALGFVQAAIATYDTFPVLQYRHQVAASERGLSQIVEPNSYRYVRVVDAHTHFIKVATVLLLIAILYPVISLGEKLKRALALMLLAGNVVFPAGVLSEIYIPGWTGQAVAAAGALLLIAAFAGIVWGLLRRELPLL